MTPGLFDQTPPCRATKAQRLRPDTCSRARRKHRECCAAYKRPLRRRVSAAGLQRTARTRSSDACSLLKLRRRWAIMAAWRSCALRTACLCVAVERVMCSPSQRSRPGTRKPTHRTPPDAGARVAGRTGGTPLMAEYCRQLSTRSRNRPSRWSCLTAARLMRSERGGCAPACVGDHPGACMRQLPCYQPCARLHKERD